MFLPNVGKIFGHRLLSLTLGIDSKATAIQGVSAVVSASSN